MLEREKTWSRLMQVDRVYSYASVDLCYAREEDLV